MKTLEDSLGKTVSLYVASLGQDCRLLQTVPELCTGLFNLQRNG